MAPLDELSAPGSSQYSSNTMYVGDGTWDATRNDFLLPNLVGLNFDTMRYNGMGNRFKDMPGYHNLILGHGILAVMVFLFIAPAAVFFARFYSRDGQRAMHLHIYLQIFTLALTTVLFVLGFMAVGANRSLTNPHHGIGLAIYVIILVQAIGGGWLYRREKSKVRRKMPVKLVLHQWLGRAVVLLGIIQVALGLTLYGSPRFTFVLYSLWVFFLVLLYFILSYRAMRNIDGTLDRRTVSGGTGTIITEKKRGRSWLGPLLGGGALAAYIANRRRKSRSRSRSRSQSRSRVEVIPSRRGSRRGSRRDSDSFIEEKFETKKKEGGIMNTLFKGAAVLGAGALAKSWYDRRQEKKEAYSAVAPDTPSKRRRRRDSVSEDSFEVVRTDHVHRMEEGRRPGGLLPGPGNAAAAAAAISASEPRPLRPPPARRHSFDSASSSYDSTLSPSRRPQESHKLRNGLLAGAGLGFLAKKFRDRRKSKEQDRQERIEEDLRIEEERLARQGKTPSKFTGDGFPSEGRRHGRRESRTQSSDFSSAIDDPHYIRPGAIPPIPATLGGAVAGAALASGGRSSSHHSIRPVAGPSNPPEPQYFPQPESGSEVYFSSGGAQHRRRSSTRRREGEEAAAVAAAAGLAAEEAARRRSRSRDDGEVINPPVSVKVKMHGDRDQKVTLRRLTEQEVAAEKAARRSHRQRRADSVSSQSGTDAAPAPRYRRRDQLADEIEAEMRAAAVVQTPLKPPNPAFASGKRPKDSAYYSGRPEGSGVAGSVGSPDSHGTWSGMSPGSGSEADRRRRRRRLERTRPSGTVDFN